MHPVITAPADPTICAAIELLKMIADPVATEKKLREIAEQQAAAEQAKADAAASLAQAEARAAELGTQIAEAGKALEHQRRVEADNKRRTEELQGLQRELDKLHDTIAEDTRAKALALDERERVLNQKGKSQDDRAANMARELDRRESIVRADEARLAEETKAVAALRHDYDGKIAKLKGAMA